MTSQDVVNYLNSCSIINLKSIMRRVEVDTLKSVLLAAASVNANTSEEGLALTPKEAAERLALFSETESEDANED